MKRTSLFSSFAVAIIAIASVLTMASCPGETFTPLQTTEGGVIYRLDNDNMEDIATGYSVNNGESLTNLEIPAYVEVYGHNYAVTAIADGAFIGADIKTVQIGSNVRTIGSRAFIGSRQIDCVSLTGTVAPALAEDAFNEQTYVTAELRLTEGCDITNTNWELFIYKN